MRVPDDLDECGEPNGSGSTVTCGLSVLIATNRPHFCCVGAAVEWTDMVLGIWRRSDAAKMGLETIRNYKHAFPTGMATPVT